MKIKAPGPRMKAALLLVVSLCGFPFGMDQKNLTLKAGVRGGVPQGAGVSTRLTAYLFNLEGALNYGYYINTMQMGFGFRLPVGGRNEFFLNVGGDRVYSRATDLELSQGFWSELQLERKIGRTPFTALLAAGGVLYLDRNEAVNSRAFPALRVGMNRVILGF